MILESTFIGKFKSKAEFAHSFVADMSSCEGWDIEESKCLLAIDWEKTAHNIIDRYNITILNVEGYYYAYFKD